MSRFSKPPDATIGDWSLYRETESGHGAAVGPDGKVFYSAPDGEFSVQCSCAMNVPRAVTEWLTRDAGELTAGDSSVYELLFLAGIEGISTLSRGGKGCVYRAVELLRPDIAAEWDETDDPAGLMRKHFPDGED